jgi:hypothetical protein
MTAYNNDDSFFPEYSGSADNLRPNVKITTSSLDVYQGYNLALSTFIAPVNTLDNLCLPDYSPVKVTMQNIGKEDYDFSKDSVVLRLEVINPKQTKDTASITIKMGTLKMGEIDTFELTSVLPVMYAGNYELKVWIENNSLDNVPYDDTIRYIYTSGKTGLPLEEDFSSNVLADQFLTIPILGTEVWTPYSDTNSLILPPAGNGMLRYIGTHGAITQLTTRQLDLYGAVDPKMDFWYYHDTSANDLDLSYTEVNIVVDGVPISVLTLYRKGVVHGWQQYSIDLKAYTNEQCVLVQFESMNRFGLESAQYLGFVSITSTPDLSVTSILISPEITACKLANKEVRVVLSTTTNQSINCALYTTSLTVEIGTQTIDLPLQQVIEGNSSDTISVATDADLTGITHIKAYLTSPVDNNALNDTANFVLDVRPSLLVTVNSITGGKDCLKIGTEIQQEVVLINDGNIDISAIKLKLRIMGSEPLTEQTILEEDSIDLPMGDTLTYLFVNTYTVPAEADYQVLFVAYMECDSARVHASHAINECADIHDLSIIDLVSPSDAQEDVAGSTNNITVSIENKSDLNGFEDVSITALIVDVNEQTIDSLADNISSINPLETISFSFTQGYTVPHDSVYSIKVYLDKVDNYPETDTLTRKRNVGEVGIYRAGNIGKFSLEQNIPNPTEAIAHIDYYIPEAGDIVFHLYSISGQTLYTKTINSMSGKHSIEWSIVKLPSGVYFYSAEYKGQRLVKRMIIKR